VTEKEFSVLEHTLFKACSFGRKAGTPYDLQHVPVFWFWVYLKKKNKKNK